MRGIETESVTTSPLLKLRLNKTFIFILLSKKFNFVVFSPLVSVFSLILINYNDHGGQF